MKPVKWGILGVSGHFKKRVLLPMKKSASVELYGIASRDGKKAAEAAASYSIPKYYSGYEDLLEDPDIEAVYIPLPNNLHVEWVKKAADRGKHILCEKPLALTAGDAEELVEYTEKKKVFLMEAFMYKFHPQWMRARELATVGEIGSVRAIQTFFSYNNPDPNNIRNKLELGGGAIYDIGCYAVSTARFIFGREPEKVVSLIERDRIFRTDSLVSGILDFNGAHAVFTVGTLTFREQKVYIHGSTGRITVNLPFNAYPDVPLSLTIATSVGQRDVFSGPADQYGLEFEAFSRSVRENIPVPYPPIDAVNNLKVMDALFGSEKSGNWEKI